MADVSGFLKIKRKEAGNRPLNERICDHSEVEQVLNSEDRMLQASRCMDCGIPFCHWSCPVDNLIPEWNDLLYKGDWKAAYSRLAATNNFPEFTGRICPASCEHACVLNINKEPVTIRENEVAIVEKAFSEGYIKPQPPKTRTGKKVAVIGSGPAGMAASDNPINAEGKKVLVIGGGDTGSDCVGTAIRQKAVSVTQIEIMPKPPLNRTDNNPWPYFGKVLKTSTSHEEGCERFWSLATVRFLGKDNQVTGVEVEDVAWSVKEDKYTMAVLPGTKRIIPADLVLLAMGFVHPVIGGLLSELEVELDQRKNIKVDKNLSKNRQKDFAAGDSVSGATLVVNAIASGKKVAKEIDRFLRKA